MWNNNNSRAPPFPTPGYNSGYSPSYSSPPAAGYPPPSGPPPSGYPPSNYSSPGGYTAPPGPPPGGQYGGYAPPMPQYGGQPQPPQPGGFPGAHQGSGYPGQQFHQSPPPGPPPNRYGGQAPMPPSQPQHYGAPGQQGGQQPYFQYSQCNGKKKALCIGINYFKQRGELKGCINDARNIQNFLISRYGYNREDIVMLTDDAHNPRQQPTRQNIMQAMQWLVRDARPNDSLFFHYSGHGGQTKDKDGDEADGYDEVIYPVDFERSGHIVDDTMHDILVKSLPAGCRLTTIFDSCHSGSALDLPYIYSTEGKIKEPNLAAEAGMGLLGAVSSYAKGDMGGVFKSAMGIVKTASGGGQKADKYAKATRTSPADVISWSGCKDTQTSADAFEAGSATGAMSFAFMSTLSKDQDQTYQQLLVNIREILRAKYSQKPQLSSSHPMDTNLKFIC